MLFAEQPEIIPGWVLFLFGGAGGGALGSVGVFLFKLLDRRKADKAAEKAEADKDEQTALDRLKAVMDLREHDCNKRIDELKERLARTETRVEALTTDRDKWRDRQTMYYARQLYLETMLRKAGIEVEQWEPPDTKTEGLPAVNLKPKE